VYFSSLSKILGGQTFLSEKHSKEFASHSFGKNDLKHELNFGKEFASEGVEAAYIVRTIF